MNCEKSIQGIIDEADIKGVKRSNTATDDFNIGQKKQEEIKQQCLCQAQEYLNLNDELRCALGIPKEEQLLCEPLGAGEHNDNYVFFSSYTQEKYVLRINKVPQHFHSDQVSYEEYALQILQVSGRVPEVLYRDSSCSKIDKGVLVISFCEGSELNFDALREGDLFCAAQLMADIHAVEVPDNCQLHCSKNAMQELFNECVARYEVYKNSAYTNERITKFAEQFIAKTQDMLQACEPLPANMRIINTETLPSHFLISESNACKAAKRAKEVQAGQGVQDQGGRVEKSAQQQQRQRQQQNQQQHKRQHQHKIGVLCDNPGFFIDWERPIIGDIAQDLAYFVAPTTTFWDSDYYFSPKEVPEFLQNYWRAVDGRFSCPDFEERFKVWQALTAMRSTTWCCRAYALCKGDSASSPSAKVRDKLQAYLSDDFLNMLLKDYF